MTTLPIGPVPGTDEKSQVKQNIAIQQLFTSVNALNTDAWTAYTPTITATVGTFTTVSATGFYRRIGSVVHINVRVAVTTNGTAAGAVVFSLPFTAHASDISSIYGMRENDNTVVSGYVFTTTTAFIVLTSTGTYPAVDGSNIRVSGAYWAA